jgi:nucleotide-binding universal stress UspA family protein
MPLYTRVMVGLDLSETDACLVRYAAMLSRLTRPEKVYFIHVTGDLHLPAAVRAKHQQALEQFALAIRSRMRDTVHEHFHGHPHTETVCEVAAGHLLEELRHQAHQQDIDLVLVGKKGGEQDTSTLPAKLVRKAPCSVLVVPSDVPPQATRTLVPVDFSEPSADAMEIVSSKSESKSSSNRECMVTS